MGDNGGNRVLVCATAPANNDLGKCKTKLHGYWDGLPGSGESPITARARAASVAAADAANAADLDPEHWISESFALARTYVYTMPVDVGDGPFVLNSATRVTRAKSPMQQVALAGARLANLLNASVKTQ